MEHTYCASMATAAVLLSTTLRQKRPMGIQHLDGFHLSGLGRKTARGAEETIVGRGSSGTGENEGDNVQGSHSRHSRLLTAGHSH